MGKKKQEGEREACLASALVVALAPIQKIVSYCLFVSVLAGLPSFVNDKALHYQQYIGL